MSGCTRKTPQQLFAKVVNRRQEIRRCKQANVHRAGIGTQEMLSMFLTMGGACGEFSDPKYAAWSD